MLAVNVDLISHPKWVYSVLQIASVMVSNVPNSIREEENREYKTVDFSKGFRIPFIIVLM